MRAWLVLGLLVGCHGAHDAGPAWPQRAKRDLDGGESLAPHVARAIAASSDSGAASSSAAETSTAPAGASGGASSTPASSSGSSGAVDLDPLLLDDLTIEVED